jgi:hypothetical protein
MPGIKKEFQDFLLHWANARDSCVLRRIACAEESMFDQILGHADLKFKSGKPSIKRKSEKTYWSAKFPELYPDE